MGRYEQQYGVSMLLGPLVDLLPAAPQTLAPRDPWRHALWIAAAYLVDDERRTRTLQALEESVGIGPAELLGASSERLRGALEGGGMLLETRAEKVCKAARALLAAGLEDGEALLGLAQEDPRAAARVLARMPGVSKGVAQRILVRSGKASGLPLESNGLRVLARLQALDETEGWDRMLRRAVAGVEDPPQSADQSWSWIEALQAHGREVCKRTPRCGECPLAARCLAAQT